MRRAHFPVAAFATVILLMTLSVGKAQTQLPRPSQLPPAGGQAQSPQRGPAQPSRDPQQPVLGQPRLQQQPQQQQQAATPKPYTAVAISAPPPVSDPSFEAFLRQVETAAKGKNRAALAKLVVAKEFFWEGEKGDKADKRKSGIDNLTAALSLNVKDGSGWEALAGFVADPTAGSMPGRRDVICGPAEPVYDSKQLGALTQATGTDESDWGYPVQPGLEVRAAPQPTAPVVEKLGLQFIWVMIDDSPAAQQGVMLRIVTPSGKLGYVPADAINPLGSDQLCYVKDAAGAWKIAGFIGDQ